MKILLLFCLFLTFVTSAHSQDDKKDDTVPKKKRMLKPKRKKKKLKPKSEGELRHQHQTKFSLKRASWRYAERGLMTDYGPLYGISIDHKFSSSSPEYFNIEFEYLQGNTRYEGGLFDSNNPGTIIPYNEDSENSFYFLNGNYNFYLPSSVTNIFSIGFYFRKLVNEDGPGPFDYEREQYYYTFPFSWILEKDINQESKLSLKTRLHFIFYGKNITHLEDVSSSAPTLSFAQDEGIGYSIEFIYQYKKFFAALSYERWEVEDSEINSGYLEPENHTNMTSLSIGYVF